ncbi:MAG TPA: ATP-binding protein [Nocardioides sp.]|nr:ATP-binding protein [Nocardioides sp.]
MEGTAFALLRSLKGTTVTVIDAEGRFEVLTPASLDQLALEEAPVDQAELLRRRTLYAEDGVTPLTVDDLAGSRALAGEVVEDMLVCVRAPDGTVRYQRVSAAPDLADDGRIRGAVILVRDVTEEHVLALREADLRRRLIDVINHQFRTPLTSILGNIELLEDMEVELPAPAATSLARVLAASRRLAELTREVSELVDLEAATRATYTDADLMPVLRPVLEAQQREARGRDVTVIVDLPSRLTALVDRSLVARAVKALVDNAVTHTPAGATVTVRHEADGHGLQLIVEDDGPGIPAGDRERLLEPFEVGAGAAGGVYGRGLGLALAATVASAHGGRVELGDRAPRGLRATLSLPRQPGPAGTTSRP